MSAAQAKARHDEALCAWVLEHAAGLRRHVAGPGESYVVRTDLGEW